MSVFTDELQRRLADVDAKKALVEDTRALLARQEHDVLVAQAHYDGFAQALALLDQPIGSLPRPVVPRRTTDSKRGGRQPGAISKIWRGILEEMSVRFPRGATDEQIAEIGRGGNLPNLRPRDARRQMQKYHDLGFVEYTNPITRAAWLVKPLAAEKFNIAIGAAGRSAETDSSTETEEESAAESESATNYLQHWSVPRHEP